MLSFLLQISDKLKELQLAIVGADNVRTAKEKWTR
jgi:hypothetical protein